MPQPPETISLDSSPPLQKPARGWWKRSTSWVDGSSQSLSWKAFPFIFLQASLFGTSMVAARFSVGQFQPLTLIALRLILASLGSLAFYLFAGPHSRLPTDKSLWKHAAVLGIFGTAVPLATVVSALQFQSSGITSILLTLMPAVTVVLAHYFLKDERLSRRKLLGVLLAFSGALWLAFRNENGLAGMHSASLVGYGLVLLGGFSGAASTIYARRFMGNYDTFDVHSVRILVATLLIVPLSLALAGLDLRRATQVGYLALGYSAITGTFLGFLLSFYNIKRFGATIASTVSYINPIITGLTGWLLLGEQITSGMLLGAGLILAGIASLNQQKPTIHQP